MLTRVRLAAAVAAGALTLALAGCTQTPGPLRAEVSAPASTPASSPSSLDATAAQPAQAVTPAGGPFTFAVVGDSLSVGNSPLFEQGEVGDRSWVAYAQGEGVEFIGGTAVVGATSWWQLERARALPEEVLAADVLVMALGTNDMSATSELTPTIDALVDIAALWEQADRVLLLAVPPRLNELAVTTADFNHFLQNLAAEHDWEFVDAASEVRDGDAWAAGMTGDGIHYTREAIPLIGLAVGEALRGER